MHFILAITTFNRYDYLKQCIASWSATRSVDAKWTLIVADDGSDDETLNYLESLSIDGVEKMVLKNKRIGVHQQMNEIIKVLDGMEFDICFKADDDITFLKEGWDLLYHSMAMNTGQHHLVFCEHQWEASQLLKKTVTKGDLVGNVVLENVHGFFYTLTPQVIAKVGYFDAQAFGFRGMGHVDYTARCARLGFTSSETPWDVVGSGEYISAFKETYNGALSQVQIGAYDRYYRTRKQQLIADEGRNYVAYQAPDLNMFQVFKDELLEVLTIAQTHSDEDKNKLQAWYDAEYEVLPLWFKRLGHIVKRFQRKK